MAVFITGGQAAERKYDENTLFLLHGGTFEDSSMYGRLITNVGVTAATDRVKFGGTSLYFELGDYLTIPAIDFGNRDFTVDWWEYVTDAASGTRFTTVFSDAYASKSGGMLAGCYENASKIYISAGASGASWGVLSQGACFTNNALNAWTHRAIVRNGSSLIIFTNGVLEKTHNIGTNVIGYNADRPFCIGAWATDILTSNFCFRGWIDEFRISGIARWTSNFTPPTEPHEV